MCQHLMEWASKWLLRIFKNGWQTTRKTRATLHPIWSYARDRNTRTFIWLHQVWWQERWGGQQKIIVPKSLRQQILKECHDLPFIGHMGMHKTLQFVDRQFHWQGLQGDIIKYVKTALHVKWWIPMMGKGYGKGRIAAAFGNSFKEMVSCSHGPRH